MKKIYTSFMLSILTFTSFNAKAEINAYDAARLIQKSQNIADADNYRDQIEDFTLVKNVTLNEKMSFLIWERPVDRTKNDIVVTIKTPKATNYDELGYDAYFVLPYDKAFELVRTQGRTYNEQFKKSYPNLVGGKLQKFTFGVLGTITNGVTKITNILPNFNTNNSNIDISDGLLAQISADFSEEKPKFIYEELNPIDNPLGELLRNIGYFFSPHILDLNFLNDRNNQIYFIGHGFGGVIAQYLSNKYKKPGFSFASMGLGQFKKYLETSNEKKERENQYAYDSFVNYIRDNDAYGSLNFDYYGRVVAITGLPLSAVPHFDEKKANVEKLYTSYFTYPEYLNARYALMIEYLLANHSIDGYVEYLDTIFNAEMREQLRRTRDSLLSEAKEVLNVMEEALDDIAVDIKAGWNTFKNGVNNFFNGKK